MGRWDDRVLLGSASNPAVEFLDIAAGDRVPWPAISSAPFDHGLTRLGWIAVQTGYALHSVRDGDVDSVKELPPVWMIHPAADPSQLIGRLRSTPAQTVLFDADGDVLAHSPDMVQPCGELHGGIVVCDHELRTWAGEVSPLPVPGRALGVLDGAIVITWDDGMLRAHDVRTEQTMELDLRDRDVSLWGNPTFDDLGERGAWSDGDTVVVAGPGTQLRVYDCEKPPYRPVWMGPDHLLLAAGKGGRVLDLATGEIEVLDGLPAKAWPQLDVTGRFAADALRSDQAPPTEHTELDDDTWDAAIATQRVVMADAARQAGLGPEVADDALPAVRLLPRLGPGPVASTRLGGLPDVPAGWAWPRHDGAPMAFLAQLRIARLSDGLVSIFGQIEPDGSYPDEPHAVHVEVFDPHAELAQADAPGDLDAELRFGAAAVVPEPFLSPPCGADLEETYDFDPLEEFEELIEPAQPLHQVLGWMNSFQGQTNPEGQQLLLQLDSDAIMGAMWSDGGRLFIWGPEDLPASGVVDGCTIDSDSC